MNRRCGARAEGKFICTLPSRKEETPPLWWGKDKRFSLLFPLSSFLFPLALHPLHLLHPCNAVTLVTLVTL